MNKSKLLTVVIVFLLVIVVGILILFGTSPAFRNSEVYSYVAGLFSKNNTHIVSKILEPDLKGLVDYGVSNDNIIVAQEDGVHGINNDGEWIWEFRVSLREPFVIVEGKYVVVTDLDGQSVLLFENSNLLWKYDFPEGVVNVHLNSNGTVTVAHGEKGYRSAISVMTVAGDGKGTGTIRFTRKLSERYIVSAISSPSGDQVFVNTISTEGGGLESSFSFLKMETGEVFSSKVINESIFPLASYLKNNIISVNSDKIISYNVQDTSSQDNDSYDVVWESKDSNSSVLTASVMNDKYIIFATGAGNNSVFSTNGGSKVFVVDDKKNVVAEFSVVGTVNNIYVGNNDIFAVCTENNVYYYDVGGKVIYEYNTISTVKKVYIGKEKSIVFTNKDIHILTEEVLPDEQSNIN